MDTINTNFYNNLSTMAKWGAPCTFARTEKAPLDNKSCFETYADLMGYINDATYGTAYPGQIVAVTSVDDAGQGLYIITSTGSTLVPVKLGTKQEIDEAGQSATINWLTGDESEEEEEEEPTPGD